jgi:hypothetical protein
MNHTTIAKPIAAGQQGILDGSWKPPVIRKG